MPKISVILPIFNVQAFIGNCLNSILAQTLQDFEVICINDSSTDETLDILEYFARKDDRIKIINQENQGPGIARNNGIVMAKGEYISFIDPDDTINEQMLELMYCQAKQFDSDIVICNYQKYQTWSGKVWQPAFFSKADNYTKTEELNIKDGIIGKDDLLSTLLISPCYSCNRIYKKEFLLKNNINFASRKCYEDCIFILKSHILANTVTFTSYIGYNYYLHKTSILRSYDKRYIDLFETFLELKEFLETKDMYAKLELNMHYFKTMNAVWTYNNLPRTEKYNLLEYVNRYFTKQEKKEFRKELKIRFIDRIKYVFSKIYSEKKLQRHKAITVLGITVKIRNLTGRTKIEQYYIDKIKKEQKKFNKDTYLLFDCLHDVSAEAVDAYSLFEYMRSIGLSAYYVVRKQSKLYNYLCKEGKLNNVIVLNFSSRSHPNEFISKIYPVLLKTKAVITSFGENSGTIDLFFKRNPYWQYIFIQHGTTYLKESVLYNGYLYPKKFDKVLVCSDKEEALFIKYGFEQRQLIKVGLPRWDLLKQSNKVKSKSILLMLTWRHLNNINFNQSLYKKNLYELINSEELYTLLKQNNIDLYFVPHHALVGNCKIDFNISNTKFKVIDSNDISKYIRECDCLITDFSSVAFDFMFQNKLVLFYIMDRYDNILGKWDKEDLSKFDYKKYILPNICFNYDELIEQIKKCIKNDLKLNDTEQEIYEKFFFTKENIREQIVKKIETINLTDKA